MEFSNLQRIIRRNILSISGLQDLRVTKICAWWQHGKNTFKEHNNGEQKKIECLLQFLSHTRQQSAKNSKAMKLAGKDIQRFKSHSMRMATASKAIDRGASVDEVMWQRRQRSKNVITTFYNRSQPKNFLELLFR